MATNFFRGTSAEQDGRWSKADDKLIQKLTKEGKFAAVLEKKVNLKKVNLDVINKWITEKVTQIVGSEDEILINTVINLIQTENIDAKRIQLQITPFLTQSSPSFMEELWTLLTDAQQQPSGIPMVFIEKKRQEILLREAAEQTKKLNEKASESFAVLPQASTKPPPANERDNRRDDRGRENSSERSTRKIREESPPRARRDEPRDDRRRDDSFDRRNRERDRHRPVSRSPERGVDRWYNERDRTRGAEQRERGRDDDYENSRRRRDDSRNRRSRRDLSRDRSRTYSPPSRRRQRDESPPVRRGKSRERASSSSSDDDRANQRRKRRLRAGSSESSDDSVPRKRHRSPSSSSSSSSGDSKDDHKGKEKRNDT